MPSAVSTPRFSPRVSGATPTQRNLSAFAPWDRDQLVARLSTFTDILWSQLPDELCEFEWARRGWIQRKDSKKGVECDLCRGNVQIIWDLNELRNFVLKEREQEQDEKEDETKETDASDSTPRPSASTIEMDNIFTKIPESESETTELLLRHHRPLLSSGHNGKCPWRSRSAEPAVLRLPPQQLMLTKLTARLQTLTPIVEFLPPLDRIVVPKPLPGDLPIDLSGYDQRVLAVGLTGWTGSLLGSKGMLTCETCHRRIALWLFTSDGDSTLVSEEEQLDLLAQHKCYCPWISARVQTGEPGWEQMHAQLVPSGGIKRTRETEKESQLKRLRQMLGAVKK